MPLTAVLRCFYSPRYQVSLLSAVRRTSELSASALIVFAFMFAYLGLKEERRWKIYLSAIFLGFSLNIRVQSLFFAPLLLAMALFPAQGTRLRWFLHCLALPIVFTLAASPTLV